MGGGASHIGYVGREKRFQCAVLAPVYMPVNLHLGPQISIYLRFYTTSIVPELYICNDGGPTAISAQVQVQKGDRKKETP